MSERTVHLQRMGVGTYFDLLDECELPDYGGSIVQLAGPVRVATREETVFLCEILKEGETMEKKGRTPRTIKECPHNPGISCDTWKNEPQRCEKCSWNDDKVAAAPPEGD